MKQDTLKYKIEVDTTEALDKLSDVSLILEQLVKLGVTKRTLKKLIKDLHIKEVAKETAIVVENEFDNYQRVYREYLKLKKEKEQNESIHSKPTKN